MKYLLFFFSLTFFSISSYSQLTKGNWLVGGNFNYTSQKNDFNQLGTGKSTALRITPNVGFFVATKFATGLKVNIENDKYILNSGTTSSSLYGAGPFLRYYYLAPDSRINLFTELTYLYMVSKPSKQSSNAFSFQGGGVVFLNQSIGIELTGAYTFSKSSEGPKYKKFQIGIGFQIHLEKDNE